MPERFRFIPADLSSLGGWEKEFENVDCVYHLADVVAGIGYVFANEGQIFRENLLINANVTKVCERYRVGRYVYVGTACSFPHHLQSGAEAPPLKEEQQFPASPESAYGWSKLMGELDATYLMRESGIDSVILVLHNVYGAPSDYKGVRAQAIPALVWRALSASDGGLAVWVDGGQGRSFIHVSDVVDALVIALIRGSNVGAIQIGTSICTRVRDLASTIVSIVNPSLEVVFDLTKPSGDRGRCADWSKAQAVLGWQPRIALDHGIRDLADWIRQREGLGSLHQ